MPDYEQHIMYCRIVLLEILVQQLQWQRGSPSSKAAQIATLQTTVYLL